MIVETIYDLMYGKIIWIEGIVGIGKSTLAEIITHYTTAKYRREPVDENVYLKDFYKDMKRWSFAMQMDLLYSRFDQHWEAQYCDDVFIFDRGILGDKVFAELLHQDGFICDRKYDTYLKTHNVMTAKLKKPDLVIYLDGTPEMAHKRVLKRNRDQESDNAIPLDYLYKMNKIYHEIFLSENKDDFLEGVKIMKLFWNDNAQFNAPIVGQLKSEFGI